MPSCFVVGCKSGNNGSGGNHLFRIPSKASEDTLSQWIKNLPKREIDFSPQTHRVCHLHFEKEFIDTHYYIVRNGVRENLEERRTWRLLYHAVPTKFSNHVVPAYFDKKSNKRKAPTDRSKKMNRFPVYEKFLKSVQLTPLPDRWRFRADENKFGVFKSEDSAKGVLLINAKALTVDNQLVMSAYIHGKDVSSALKFQKMSQLSDFMENLRRLEDDIKICNLTSSKPELSASSVSSGRTSAVNISSGLKSKIPAKNVPLNESERDVEIIRPNAEPAVPTENEDKFTLFGKAWGSKLREVPTDQMIHAEKLINDVLYEALLGNLNRNCSLSIPTTNGNS